MVTSFSIILCLFVFLQCLVIQVTILLTTEIINWVQPFLFEVLVLVVWFELLNLPKSFEWVEFLFPVDSGCTQQLTSSALLTWKRWSGLHGGCDLAHHCWEQLRRKVLHWTHRFHERQVWPHFSSANRFEFHIHRFNLTRMSRILISPDGLLYRPWFTFLCPWLLWFSP